MHAYSSLLQRLHLTVGRARSRRLLFLLQAAAAAAGGGSIRFGVGLKKAASKYMTVLVTDPVRALRSTGHYRRERGGSPRCIGSSARRRGIDRAECMRRGEMEGNHSCCRGRCSCCRDEDANFEKLHLGFLLQLRHLLLLINRVPLFRHLMCSAEAEEDIYQAETSQASFTLLQCRFVPASGLMRSLWIHDKTPWKTCLPLF